MGSKKDLFDSVLDKQFSSSSPVQIAKPLGGERTSSFEERRRLAVSPVSGEPAATEQGPAPAVVKEEPVEVQENVRKIGRPKVQDCKMTTLYFNIPVDLKYKLDELRLKQYRSSRTELVMEAIRDLLTKYGAE